MAGQLPSPGLGRMRWDPPVASCSGPPRPALRASRREPGGRSRFGQLDRDASHISVPREDLHGEVRRGRTDQDQSGRVTARPYTNGSRRAFMVERMEESAPVVTDGQAETVPEAGPVDFESFFRAEHTRLY